MIAMALGVALGIYRPDFAIQMQPFGDLRQWDIGAPCR